MKLFFITIILLSFNHVFADTFFVQDAQGVNVSKEDAAAVTELVKNAVGESGSHSLAPDSKSARFTLKPKILKLGNSFVMTLDKLSGSQQKFSGQLKASSMDEMDKISTRLVRAVIDEKAVKGDARLDDVTDAESTSIGKRKETLRRWYVGLGPGSTSNLNTTGVQFGFSIAYAWDMKDAALKLI